MNLHPAQDASLIKGWSALFERARNARIFELEAKWRRTHTPQFNIFSALGLGRNETRHSWWLAFLLNPRETHEFGALFLKQFLNRLHLFDELTDVDLARYQWGIDREVDIAEGGSNTVERGRLDIVVRCKNKGVILGIENKIDAPFQGKQLERYASYLSKEPECYTTRWLVLLTPMGRKNEETCRTHLAQARKISLEHQGAIQIQQTTYEEDIYPCLQSIISKTASLRLGSLLEQYINIIKVL